MTWFLEAISEDLQCARTTKVFEHNLGIGMKKLHPNELTDMYREFNSCVSDDRCFQYNYQEEPDYSYIQPVYFKEYMELLEEIRSTQKQKWLIFVDSEPAGMQFAQELKNAGVIGVGMISRNQINRSSEARKIYETIVEKEAFSQRILITTSVMDCGINIHDSMVKNIVIACDNKTGFLQMLGRKRIDEGENIRLFIKTYGYRTIQNANQGLNFPKSNGKHCERNAAKDMQEQALRRAHFGSGLNIRQVAKPIEERFDGLPHRRPQKILCNRQHMTV